MSVDERQLARILRRDAELAHLSETLGQSGAPALRDMLLEWAAARDADRRSLANEALERYSELNLLYDLAERCTSLDPGTVIRVATSELRRAVRRGTSLPLVTDEAGTTVRPLEGTPDVARTDMAFPFGEGIIGSVAAGADGEIVNDPASDPRATAQERGFGAIIVAPLRAAGRHRGVVLVVGPRGAEFTAGEFRLVSAVAALTAPALDAALLHARTLAAAREREAELERQLEALRSEVEERRREERVSEITGTDYFRSLRQQADVLRRTLNADAPGGDE